MDKAKKFISDILVWIFNMHINMIRDAVNAVGGVTIIAESSTGTRSKHDCVVLRN